MKFGLFYEAFVPAGEAGAEARILRELVEQIVVADQHGWHQVWLTEHHFLKQFSHMSAPEVIFGAAAHVRRMQNSVGRNVVLPGELVVNPRLIPRYR